MFTVEYEHDTIEIVILDDKGYDDDLRIEIEDNGVYISQWNSTLNEDTNIRISNNYVFQCSFYYYFRNTSLN